MAENSPIEWTDHTFNPWWGCSKISPACDHCYAEAFADRLFPDGNLWKGSFRYFGPKHWAEPLKWQRKAELSGTNPRVFCASMADVFDKNASAAERVRLWDLIGATPHLRWLLLTKRIGNARAMLPESWGYGWPNVWLGITVVNQEEANRDVPKLLSVPAFCRFLSCEPLLEKIDLRHLEMTVEGYGSYPITFDALTGRHRAPALAATSPLEEKSIDWVIAGGESGPQARPAHPDWFRSLRDQCAAARVPFLFKQWGEWASVSEVEGRGPHFTFADGATVRRIGKHAAGRMLDGRLHDDVPS